MGPRSIDYLKDACRVGAFSSLELFDLSANELGDGYYCYCDDYNINIHSYLYNNRGSRQCDVSDHRRIPQQFVGTSHATELHY